MDWNLAISRAGTIVSRCRQLCVAYVSSMQ